MGEDNNRLQEPESVEQLIDNMTLMDDDLFGLVFDKNIPATELLLKAILKRDDIKVITVTGQRELRNPEVGGRDIRLDILAEDGAKRQFDVEVQRRSAGAHPKRARFHSAMIDARMLKSGSDFVDLKESYVIFITENDYYKRGLPLYTINRHIEEFDGIFEDESHIIYVNGTYRGDDELGYLMQDFQCKNSKVIQHEVIAEGVKHFKESEGGRKIMCESVERYADQKAEIKAIRSVVEASIELKADKNQIVTILMNKFELTEEQAEIAYERYAPALA